MDGYQFDGWEGTGLVSKKFRFTNVHITQDINITAKFSPLKIVENLDEIEDLGNDWYSSGWFGLFYQFENGWSYHLNFGWIFPVVHESNSIWFWHESLGWLWVRKSFFTEGFIWSKSSNSWLYIMRDSGHTEAFYDYGAKDWIEF